MAQLKDKWNQVVIPTSDVLTGKGMLDLINITLQAKKFKYIIIVQMEAQGEVYLMRILRNLQYTPIRIKDFASTLQDIECFEWGSFYLFEDYPDKWDDPDHSFYPYVVEQTDSTIRAVDGSYAILYTPYDSVVEIIKKNYAVSEIKTDHLENLEYPF